MLILLAIVLLLVLPHPWNVIGAAVAVVLGIGELAFWNRTVRGRRRVVGAETLIGREAVVVEPCTPEGRVRIDAETWAALCEEGASTGATVQVVGRRGLQLLVTPIAAARTPAVTRKE